MVESKKTASLFQKGNEGESDGGHGHGASKLLQEDGRLQGLRTLEAGGKDPGEIQGRTGAARVCENESTIEKGDCCRILNPTRTILGGSEGKIGRRGVDGPFLAKWQRWEKSDLSAHLKLTTFSISS